MGIVDLEKKYELKDIVRGDSIFCATGITNGELVKGVETFGDYFMTDTFVTHKSKNIKKNIQLHTRKYLFELQTTIKCYTKFISCKRHTDKNRLSIL